MTKQQSARAKLLAVAIVIRASGYNAMARQWMQEPIYRGRIVKVIAKEVARKTGDVRGQDFERLANHAIDCAASVNL